MAPFDARFAHAVQVILQHEGDFSDHPSDRGGRTRYGISQARYPDLDITTLTREQAIALYYQDWWLAYGYERIQPLTIATKVFDAAVNMGARPAHRALQRAIRACGISVSEDGLLGQQTLTALHAIDVISLLPAYRSELAAHYRLIVARNPSQDVFLRGWLARAYA
jgi:lysozyme family protein